MIYVAKRLASLSDSHTLAGYYGKFNDGAPGSWSTAYQDELWTIQLPNNVELRFKKGGAPRWTQLEENDSPATTLWRNSLRYVPTLIQEDRSLVSARAVLESFRRFQDEIIGSPRAFRTGSFDHQLALQLRSMCSVRSLLAHEPLNDNAKVVDELCSQIVENCFRLVFQEKLLYESNHGIMLAIAVFHAHYMYSINNESALDYAQEFFKKSLENIVDSYGVANENTPMYQSFYIRILEDTLKFLEWAELEWDFTSWLRNLTKLVEVAFRKMLLSDGSTPPLGDGNRGYQQTYPPIFGELLSSTNGLYVASDEDLYFSFICGQRGIIHKQLDDTSIFLNHNGNTLINDAGLLSYDRSDPMALTIRSQRGHSGLFVTTLDGTDPGAVIAYSTATRQLDASLTPSASSVPFRHDLIGRVAYVDWRLTRSIAWETPNSFKISDRCESDQTTTAVSRFLLDPNAQVEIIDSKHWLITNSDSWMLLCVSAAQSEYKEYRGCKGNHSSGHLPKGFAVVDNSTVKSTALLEWSSQSKKDFPAMREFVISFGGINDSIACSECIKLPQIAQANNSFAFALCDKKSNQVAELSWSSKSSSVYRSQLTEKVSLPNIKEWVIGRLEGINGTSNAIRIALLDGISLIPRGRFVEFFQSENKFAELELDIQGVNFSTNWVKSAKWWELTIPSEAKPIKIKWRTDKFLVSERSSNLAKDFMHADFLPDTAHWVHVVPTQQAPEHSDSAIFVFSAMSPVGDFTYNYRAAFEKAPVHQFYLMDDAREQGAYYLCEQRDFSLFNSVQQSIVDCVDRLDLDPDKVLFVGSSKGGSAALAHGLTFGSGNIVVGAPQWNIGSFLKNPHPNVLEYMAGGTADTDVAWLDTQLPRLLSKTDFRGHVTALVGLDDHHFKSHVTPMKEFLVKQGVSLNVLEGLATPHSALGPAFSIWLRSLVPFLWGEGKPPVWVTQDNGVMRAEILLEPEVIAAVRVTEVGGKDFVIPKYSTNTRWEWKLPHGRYGLRFYLRRKQDPGPYDVFSVSPFNHP